MAWPSLGTQFCLELAFGVLLALCVIPKAPVGVFFYRLMVTTALVPLLVAFFVPPMWGGAAWTHGSVIAAGAACLAFPFASAPIGWTRRFAALIWATTCTAVALVLVVHDAIVVEGIGPLVLGSLSAMATGAVAGGVGLAMVLGHWYLTVPQLPVRLLRNVNRVTVAAMVCSGMLLTISCFAFAEALADARTPLLGPWGLFYLAARVSVGLLLPLLFAWMTASSLRYDNTRSATGILYASTVLVLIGTAVSLSLQDSYGVPL
jgi:hypothetical protein